MRKSEEYSAFPITYEVFKELEEAKKANYELRLRLGEVNDAWVADLNPLPEAEP